LQVGLLSDLFYRFPTTTANTSARDRPEEDEDGNVDEGADTEGIGSSILADMLGAVRAVRADGTDTLQVL
jgi:hypothetical protein